MTKDNIITREGYTVIYNKVDGGIGYIGFDRDADGYPFFSDRPRQETLFDQVSKAVGLLSEGKHMVTVFGSSNVDFDTMRIVSIDRVIKTIEAEELDKHIAQETLKRLSAVEVEAIRKLFLEQALADFS